MATNFMDTAKSVRIGAKGLLDRLGQNREAASSLLGVAKGAEGRLVEKEQREEKERAEREKAERLQRFLESGETNAYVGDAEPAFEQPAAAPEGKSEKHEEPVSEKAAAPVAAKAAEPVSVPVQAEEKPPKTPEAPAAQEVTQPVQKSEPAPKEAPKVEVSNAEAAPAEAAKAEAPNRPRTETAYAGNQSRPQSNTYAGGQSRPQSNTYAGGQNRPQSGTYAGNQSRPQSGAYAGNQSRPQSGTYAGNQSRPQNGTYAGNQSRPQGGYAGSQSRPQNGYAGSQSRPQGGYAGNQNRPQGGYAGGQNRTPGFSGQGRQASGQSRAVVISQPVTAKPDTTRTDPNKARPGYDKDRKNKNKKAMQKEAAPTPVWDDDGSAGGRRKGQNRKLVQQAKPVPVVIDHAVISTETITVKELSEKIGKPAAEIIKKLFLLGIMATINQDIDFDTCELIASDYNITLEQQLTKTFEDVLADNAEEVDKEEQLVDRPPVVTIMGHVDHGKTSLLDAFRNSSVAAGEAGGITQHIGAYTVTCKGRQITFIDTPGHEAFTAMRARGAQVTDIVILVVAADDGIMPQTIEAINHAKSAKVPIVVAVNKIDKPNADPDRVTQQLTEYGLVAEEWGGDTIVVPVSAKKQINLDTLLEMVLLQADVLELKANPNRLAKGTIIEAKLDKARGPIATVLVQNGTLKKGDTIIAGTAYGRIRGMIDDKGRMVNSAGPSTPVEVLGFNEVPDAGDIMNVADADKLTRQVAEERRDKIKAAQIKALQKVSLDELFNQMAEGELKELNIIIKADVAGSVEAIKQSLEKLSNEEVRVRCIHGAVGAITESDIMFASASNAIVIGFNVRPDGAARAAAEKEKVDVRTYRVIYNAIEDVEAAMKGMFKPVFKEVDLGRVSVRSTFRISGVGTVAGAYVQDGKVPRNAQVRLVRDGVVVYDGKISSLKRFKDDVKEVAAGYECGISLENWNDIKEGDAIEAYAMEQVEK